MKRFISSSLFAVLAGGALACEPISTSYNLCIARTSWAEAVITPTAEGATFTLPPYEMDYLEPYVSRSDGPLADDMAALTEFFEIPADAILLTEALTLGPRQAVIRIDRTGLAEARMTAVALVDIEGVRIQLTVFTDPAGDVQALRDTTVELVGALELECPGGCE